MSKEAVQLGLPLTMSLLTPVRMLEGGLWRTAHASLPERILERLWIVYDALHRSVYLDNGRTVFTESFDDA